MAQNMTFSCGFGGEWYAYAAGVGCCSVNPYAEICPTHALHPLTFDPTTMGSSPDLICAVEGGTMCTCSSNKTFFGCCKSNPCSNGTGVCPIGDLLPSKADRPKKISTFGDPGVNFVGAASVTTESPKRAAGPIGSFSQSFDLTKIDHPHAIRLMGVSTAVLVTIWVGIGLWLLYRKLNGQTNSQYADLSTHFFLGGHWASRQVQIWRLLTRMSILKSLSCVIKSG